MESPMRSIRGGYCRLGWPPSRWLLAPNGSLAKKAQQCEPGAQIEVKSHGEKSPARLDDWTILPKYRVGKGLASCNQDRLVNTPCARRQVLCLPSVAAPLGATAYNICRAKEASPDTTEWAKFGKKKKKSGWPLSHSPRRYLFHGEKKQQNGRKTA